MKLSAHQEEKSQITTAQVKTNEQQENHLDGVTVTASLPAPNVIIPGRMAEIVSLQQRQDRLLQEQERYQTSQREHENQLRDEQHQFQTSQQQIRNLEQTMRDREQALTVAQRERDTAMEEARENKRHRSRRDFAETRNRHGRGNLERGLPTTSILAGTTAPGWEQHLPQSESDGTMHKRVMALFVQIEIYAENFYRNAAVPISPELQTVLMKVHSSYLPGPVVSLLSLTKKPTLLIKHCLAYLIVSRITADSDAPASFLPADFVALPRAMGGTRANQDKPGKQHAKRFVTPVTDNHSICTSSLSLARSILLSQSPFQRLPLHAGCQYRGRSRPFLLGIRAVDHRPERSRGQTPAPDRHHERCRRHRHPDLLATEQVCVSLDCP